MCMTLKLKKIEQNTKTTSKLRFKAPQGPHTKQWNWMILKQHWTPTRLYSNTILVWRDSTAGGGYSRVLGRAAGGGWSVLGLCACCQPLAASPSSLVPLPESAPLHSESISACDRFTTSGIYVTQTRATTEWRHKRLHAHTRQHIITTNVDKQTELQWDSTQT